LNNKIIKWWNDDNLYDNNNNHDMNDNHDTFSGYDKMVDWWYGCNYVWMFMWICTIYFIKLSHDIRDLMLKLACACKYCLGWNDIILYMYGLKIPGIIYEAFFYSTIIKWTWF